MAKKVSKNQRTDRNKNRQQNKMAKIVFASKKDNGKYAYRTRMVQLDAVKDELQSVKN
ncbi:MAG: hypothetical protein AAGI08_05780 [Bacteroidota bacterium]